MKAGIYFEWPDGTPDYIVLDEDSIEEIREKADQALQQRNATYTGSEILEE